MKAAHASAALPQRDRQEISTMEIQDDPFYCLPRSRVGDVHSCPGQCDYHRPGTFLRLWRMRSARAIPDRFKITFNSRVRSKHASGCWHDAACEANVQKVLVQLEGRRMCRTTNIVCRPRLQIDSTRVRYDDNDRTSRSSSRLLTVYGELDHCSDALQSQSEARSAFLPASSTSKRTVQGFLSVQIRSCCDEPVFERRSRKRPWPSSREQSRWSSPRPMALA